MAVRKLRENNNLSKLEICNILVDYGFGNEEEGCLNYYFDKGRKGYLDYHDNPRYGAIVDLDDMNSYVDDYDKGEQIKDSKILRTKEDVDEFLDFIADLENGRYVESKVRKVRNRITEELDYDTVTIDDIVDICDHIKEDADKIKRVATDYPEKYNSAWRDYNELKDKLIDVETMLYELWR